jgi:hypothetical protein
MAQNEDADDEAERNQNSIEKLFEARKMANKLVDEYELDGYVECSGVCGQGIKEVVDAVLGIVYFNRGVGEGHYKSRRSRGGKGSEVRKGMRKRCTIL